MLIELLREFFPPEKPPECKSRLLQLCEPIGFTESINIGATSRRDTLRWTLMALGDNAIALAPSVDARGCKGGVPKYRG